MKHILLAVLSFLSLSSSAQQVSKEVMTGIYNEVKSPYKYGMVVAPADNGHKIDCPTVYREGDKWYMTYVIYNGSDGLDGRGYTTWLSESDDLLHWRTVGCILDYKDSGWDMNQRGGFPSLIDWDWGGDYRIGTYKGKHWMTYIGGEGTGYEGVRAPLFIGQAWTDVSMRDGIDTSVTTAHEWQSLDKPLLHINDKGAQWWEKLIQYKSTVYEDKRRTFGKRFVMFYNAGGVNPANNLKAERIGIALSNDMKKWERYKGNPVFTHEAPGIITGDAQIVDFTKWERDNATSASASSGVKEQPLYVMFYFSAFSPQRKYNAFNTFAVSRDLVHWQDWDGDDLVWPTKQYDEMFAHKSYVLKHNGVVYHFYCAVNNDGQRGIALATSRPMGKSDVAFPAPQRKAKRTVTSLSEGWKSTLTASNDAAATGKVWQGNVPHNWDDYYGYSQKKHGNLHGSALYEKTFRASRVQGKRYFLYFEGLGSYATVTVNGKQFGRRPVGRLTYTIDITDCIKDGDNRLTVLCDHPELITDMPWVCGGCSSEWGFSEGTQPFGIYRPVSLVETDEIRIEPFGVHVWNSETCDTVFIETEVKNYGDAVAEFEVVNNFNMASGKRVFRCTDKVKLNPGETTTVRQQAKVETPALWSQEDPYLYKVVSMVKRDGKTTDQVETPYGIRTFSWPVTRKDGDNRFYLNGKPVFINGTCDYDHLFGSSHAFSQEQIESRMKLIRQAGFNAYREAHQPHNLLYQQIADKEGMLFWSQFSAHIWYDTPQFRENFKQLLRQYIKERRNSPSVVMWGLQNESTLPKDFSEECTAIIRELDPVRRPVTTCNGGEGTDWNVIQNWSGTYGGTALNYDKELKQPNQLLNGEYGAWRTIGLHSEAPADSLRKEKSYSEERATDLLETKVRLAEEARDSVCGHYQWIFATHDNPGRVQPDGAYRMADKIGPVNYKGLLTSWEQPADMYYMYRSNYVSPDIDPMVYINSHTWADRFKTTGARRTDIAVYSNCDSVRLYNSADDSQYLGRKKNARKPGTHMLWEHRLIQYNVLRAVGYRGGKAVAEDIIILEGLPEAPAFETLYGGSAVVPVAADVHPVSLKPVEGQNYVLRLNCGGDSYTDTFGNRWQGDNLTYGRSWDGIRASQGTIHEPIHGTRDWGLFQTFRFGRHKLAYDFPLPDGKYTVELYFAEPWLGLGGGLKTECDGERLFSVAVNGETKAADIDLWAEAGHAGAFRKTMDVEVKGGKLTLSFPEVKAGQAVISAIAIRTADASVKPLADKSEEGFWAKVDSDRVEKLPKSMLPADDEAFPASRYTLDKKKEFLIKPGVAREYALRFRYKNTGAPITAQLRIVDQKGTVLVDREMKFPTTPKKFKLVSTTTGTQIKAGNYQVQLLVPGTKRPVAGATPIEFEYLEVQ